MPKSGSDHWADGLVGAARRIAESDATPLRVLAGPGTGKSFALMRRVMRLLDGGVSPTSVLVSTFTRTAAKDLQDELARLKTTGADKIRADTVHSVCFRLLSKAQVIQSTGRPPRPLLQFEERFLLEDLVEVLGEGVRKLRELLRAFAAAWARGQSETPGWPRNDSDRSFHRALQGWLLFHQAMLIGELVPEALKYIRLNPASPHVPRFTHVLVDEYQDLNRAEQELLDALATGGALTVVGDENQSIYSFKHAHPEGISRFHETHVGCHDENLVDCRRCPRLVVEMANELMRRNASGTPHLLRALPSNPAGEVVLVQWDSVESEVAGIADVVATRVKEGAVSAGKVLVLSPRRQMGYAIRDALIERDVPAHSFFTEECFDGDPKHLDESQNQSAFSLLTLIVNADDRVALRCWCGYGSASLNRGEWARIKAHAEANSSSPRDVLSDLLAGRLQLPRTSRVVARYQEFERRRDATATLRGRELLDALFPADAEWAAAAREAATGIEGDALPKQLLEAIRVAATQPELPTDVDYVRVMSLHKSKGLTADLVVVTSCVEGLIPRLPNAPGDQQLRALEEQRRLFFVAMTRPKQTLILSTVATMSRADALQMGVSLPSGYGTVASTMTSRFFDELGPNRPAVIDGTDLVDPKKRVAT